MKLLFDEALPRQLARSFPAGVEVSTVQGMGWTSTRNGELLRRAGSHGFDAFITVDQGIEYQQNPNTLPIPIVVLIGRGTDAPALEPLVPQIVEVIYGNLERRVYRVVG